MLPTVPMIPATAVTIEGGDRQGGEVTINANVSGSNTVLEVNGDNVEVTVKGNVTQTSANTPEYPAVNVNGAEVTAMLP